MENDLMLSELGRYYGTEQWHRIAPYRSSITDGIVYLMTNGYSWFVTDMLAVIETKLKGEEFLSVKLKVCAGNGATATIDDGNGKVLYEQHYTLTDAKVDLLLFYTNNVLMLSGEY
jgi:hypothetical protein